MAPKNNQHLSEAMLMQTVYGLKGLSRIFQTLNVKWVSMAYILRLSPFTHEVYIAFPQLLE